MKKLLKKWQKILSSMCMSGIHYLEEEIVEKNITNEEDNDEIDPKYICYYSDLPSVLNYQEEEDE